VQRSSRPTVGRSWAQEGGKARWTEEKGTIGVGGCSLIRFGSGTDLRSLEDEVKRGGFEKRKGGGQGGPAADAISATTFVRLRSDRTAKMSSTKGGDRLWRKRSKSGCDIHPIII